MVKVSITLPNNAVITFESEEPEVIHDIVGMVLRDLPRELMQSAVGHNGDGGQADAVLKISESSEQPPEQQSAAEQPGSDAVQDPQIASKVSPSPKTARATDGTPPVPISVPGGQTFTDAEAAFVDFCRTSNPLGDMRRVVVAAEGARRFLGVESVDAAGLGRLFEMAGWPRPHSFVQTLRNAARSKFRWLERVPGRSGFYTVTEIGRTTALAA